MIENPGNDNITWGIYGGRLYHDLTPGITESLEGPMQLYVVTLGSEHL